MLVFECGRQGLQSSTLSLSVRHSPGGRPWIELSKSINLFLWDPFSTEYAKQNANQLSEIIEQVGQVSVHWSNRKGRDSINEEIVE